MSFYYEPLTEEECEKERAFALMEPGIYNFTVAEAKSSISKSGNPMIEMRLRIWDHQGKEFTVFDYLLGTKNMVWKTKHFCDAVGLEKEYTEKRFNESLCAGRSGKVSIEYQAGKANPQGGFYKDKNSVADYVMTDKGALKNDSVAPKGDPTFDDDLPF